MQAYGMDYTELAALAIVGVALFVVVRGSVKKTKGTCCGKPCAVKTVFESKELKKNNP